MESTKAIIQFFAALDRLCTFDIDDPERNDATLTVSGFSDDQLNTLVNAGLITKSGTRTTEPCEISETPAETYTTWAWTPRAHLLSAESATTLCRVCVALGESQP